MTALIDIRSLTVTRNEARILNTVTFSAHSGEFIGVIGPNGAGKTTLLRAIAGLEPTQAGECLVAGKPVSAQAPIVRARHLSHLPQSRPIYWSMTAKNIIALGRFAYGAPARLKGEDAAAVVRAIEATGVSHLAERAATALSGGEAARVHVARVLAAETPILLVDEPTAALDPRHQLAIMGVLRKRVKAGGLVIAALHDLGLAAKFCSRIIIIEGGRIRADGPPPDVLTPESLASAFGVRADIAIKDGQVQINFAE